MGCQNSNSIQPMPHEVLNDHPNPKLQAKPTTNHHQNVTVIPSKENQSLPRKPSIKFQTNPLPTIKQETKLSNDMKRRSKSECYALAIQTPKVPTPQNEPDEEKIKKQILMPKLKSDSMKKDKEENVSVGPSSNSIELQPSKEVLKNEKIMFNKKQPQDEINRHFQGQPYNEAKTQSLASEKITIEPFKFQVDKSMKADTQRSLKPEQKEEVGLFMGNLFNYQNEHILQTVVKRLAEKEAKQTEFKELQSPCNTEKIMQQQILQDQKKRQNELLAAIQIQVAEQTSVANSYNTQKMMQQQILKEEEKIDREVIKNIVENKPESQIEEGPSEAACSINTQKMMQQQILEDQKRIEKEVLRALETGSTPLLTE